MEAVAVREFDEHDRQTVIELWRRCELLRPGNDPNLDIDRKLAHRDAMFFVAVLDGGVVGSVRRRLANRRLQSDLKLTLAVTLAVAWRQ